jgi:hypothetical protein
MTYTLGCFRGSPFTPSARGLAMLDIDFSRRLFDGLENAALPGERAGSLSSVLAGCIFKLNAEFRA